MANTPGRFTTGAGVARDAWAGAKSPTTFETLKSVVAGTSRSVGSSLLDLIVQPHREEPPSADAETESFEL